MARAPCPPAPPLPASNDHGEAAGQQLARVPGVDGQGPEAVEEGLGVRSREEGRGGVLARQGGAAFVKEERVFFFFFLERKRERDFGEERK